MIEWLWILTGAAIINNYVLVQFLGLCQFVGASQQRETALGLGMATTFVLTLATVAAWLLETFILAPLGADYLRTIAFILVIAATVAATEIVIRKVSPLLYHVLGIYLPLITSNCAVLGAALLNARAGFGFMGSVAHGLGAGLGFILVIVLLGGIRERLRGADVPAPFQGAPVTLMTTGVIALGFLGFSGLGPGATF